MENITFEQFNKLKFTLYEKNPIIKNPVTSFVIADPSVLTAEASHDKKYHLFCHTFFGVYMYNSTDGISFKKNKRIVNRAMRPDINYIDGVYYLFYERTKPVICNLLSLFGLKWKSEIYCTQSVDLKNWSEPFSVITKSKAYHEDERGSAISNPFLIKINNKYRLYYSCGLTFIDECGFCEPTYISFAESEKINTDFSSLQEPIISPDESSEYLNLCSGCIKVYKLKDCYIGLQNGIYKKDNKTHSAIMLLKSVDGVNFEFVRPFLVPQKCGKSNWMKQYVYACSLTRQNNKLRLYFNARNVSNNIFGREKIGIFDAYISE